ncbi:MAG: outer membrane protein assembly factor BamA [Candidatus Babeliales bacterium]
MPRTPGITYSFIYAIFVFLLVFTPVVSTAQEIATANTDAQETLSEQDEQYQDTDFDEEDDAEFDEQDQQQEPAPQPVQISSPRYIKKISIKGNRTVPTEAIANRVPYQVGELFEAGRTRELIQSVYSLGNLPFGIGYFRNIKIAAEHVGTDGINLIIIVDEKDTVNDVIFRGNKHLSQADIEKKIPLDDLAVVDQEDLGKYISVIKQLYSEKNYHSVGVEAHLERINGAVNIIFTINEEKKSFIKRVYFKGNNAFSSKKLRSLIFTREDWVLGFLNRAGSYQPEAIEADKYVIENFYQSNGFLHASVYDAKIDINPDCPDIYITFYVDEGEQYCINTVRAPGNEILDEETILQKISIKPGQLFSKDKIRENMENLRLLWGEYGYIYADIAPSIQPDEDSKTVDITFYSELGSEVHLNRITIIGNAKTRDRIIRRNLLLKEGELLTTNNLDASKLRVENLGYFDQRDGVNWKINRIGKNLADLDLILKEVKTGQVNFKIGFGGSPTDITNPNSAFSIGGNISDTNLLGLGIQGDFGVELSKDRYSFNLNVTEPWLFDKPIYGSFDAFYKFSNYEDLDQTRSEIKERFAGGSLNTGFYSKKLNNTLFAFELGVNDIHYTNRPAPKEGLGEVLVTEYQQILDRRFLPGFFPWFGAHASIDLRNHPMHPSRGYQWNAYFKIGIPANTRTFLTENDTSTGVIIPRPFDPQRLGYWKIDADASWYTPLIGEHDLVFCLHAHAGIVSTFKDTQIPFRELYHIGGPASVRGFLFGQIGPTWLNTESIGGTKALWLNAELIFPVSGDLSMKGAFFYDGGAGWDTPDARFISKNNLRNNNFGYRHAIGFGLRLLRPTPVKLDWGFKLDRKKNEPASEAHLTMYHNF